MHTRRIVFVSETDTQEMLAEGPSTSNGLVLRSRSLWSKILEMGETAPVYLAYHTSPSRGSIEELNFVDFRSLTFRRSR